MKEPDLIEVEAIKDVFGEDAKKVPVSSIKSMVGESFSACGALSLVASVGAIENKFIPPTLNYSEPDSECDLDFVPNKSRKKELNNVFLLKKCTSAFFQKAAQNCLLIASRC